MTREEMTRSPRLQTRFCRRATTGYYVNSDKGEPDLSADFCYPHAVIVAAWSARETNVDTWVDSTSMGADGHRPCDFGGCDRHLDFGGLTDEGVRSALGLTESNPKECSVYASELVLAAWTMGLDDPRWELWEHHARRVIRRAKRGRR